MIIPASTVAIVAIAAAVIVIAPLVFYVLPRGADESGHPGLSASGAADRERV